MTRRVTSRVRWLRAATSAIADWDIGIYTGGTGLDWWGLEPRTGGDVRDTHVNHLESTTIRSWPTSEGGNPLPSSGKHPQGPPGNLGRPTRGGREATELLGGISAASPGCRGGGVSTNEGNTGRWIRPRRWNPPLGSLGATSELRDVEPPSQTHHHANTSWPITGHDLLPAPPPQDPGLRGSALGTQRWGQKPRGGVLARTSTVGILVPPQPSPLPWGAPQQNVLKARRKGEDGSTRTKPLAACPHRG